MTSARLLVLDDDPQTGAMVEAVSRNVGYDVLVLDTAADLMEHIRRCQPTHILLDLQMPGMDGIQVLRRLANEQSKAKLVICSDVGGRIVEAARRLGTEQGLDIAGILLKPLREPRLRALLERMAVSGDARKAPEWPVEEELARAIDVNQLFLVFQPKVELASLRVAGFEALARWNHPRRGLITPDEFLPAAETAGLMDRLTELVVARTLHQLSVCRKLEATMEMALNISAHNLQDAEFTDKVLRACRTFGVPPTALTLEVREQGTMTDLVEAMDTLTRLRVCGVKLAVDNFGTGYASLVQLHRLPFSEIKIDRSFVSEFTSSKDSRAIVKSIVELAHNLGMVAVAQGVEDRHTLSMLRDLGCDFAQGYRVSRPLPADEIGPWLAAWNEKADRGRAGIR